MNILDYYQEQIQQHQEEHFTSEHRAVDVIQILAPDLSCTYCYPSRQTSSCLPFARFWHWYQRAYQVETYSRKTQESFFNLSHATDPITARIEARNIVFSC